MNLFNLYFNYHVCSSLCACGVQHTSEFHHVNSSRGPINALAIGLQQINPIILALNLSLYCYHHLIIIIRKLTSEWLTGWLDSEVGSEVSSETERLIHVNMRIWFMFSSASRSLSQLRCQHFYMLLVDRTLLMLRGNCNTNFENFCLITRLTHRGCPIKKFPNVLLNNAKMVNLTVKPQAKGQNYFSLALKWGIVCLFKSSSIGIMTKNWRYQFFGFSHFLQFCKSAKIRKLQIF